MNVRPAPITTTARMSGSAAAASIAAAMPSGTPGLKAFTGGLSIVITPTSPWRVNFTSSFIKFSIIIV